MIDSLGKPQSILLIGGTSEIGLAIVEALSGRLRRVVLAGRDRARGEAAARSVAGGAAGTAEPLTADLSSPAVSLRIFTETGFSSGGL